MSNTARAQIAHIHNDSTSGYIEVMTLGNGQVQFSKMYNPLKLLDNLDNLKNKMDTYMSINTVYNYKRTVQNIRQLRALYIDIDNRELTYVQLVYEVWILANEGKIPHPTMVVNSGRGIHVYWRIEHAPKQALSTWQELEDYLYKQLKHLGADKKATDATRILRLVETINSKNKSKCEIVIIDNETIYSMYDLRTEYLNYKQVKFKQVEIEDKKKTKCVVKQFFTAYSLHITRAKDILTLCKIRNYEMTGYRNMVLHCYAYWEGITTRDLANLEALILDLNSKFTEPLNLAEVRAIARCVPKAVDKFIAYEQGLRGGEVKRVSKVMKDRGGYWYKNSTLIERLDITREEQTFLDTIIDEKEKYRRCADKKKEKQKKKRRNENGLTVKAQELVALKIEIENLKQKELSNRAIAKILNISEAKVRRLLLR